MSKKRALFMAFVSMISLILIIGCASQKEAASPTDGKSSPTPEATKKSIAIEFASQGTVPPPEKNIIIQKVKERLNIDLKHSATADNFEQALNLRVVSGDVPDVFLIPQNLMQKYAEQGIVLDLAKYKDKLPNASKVLTDYDWLKTTVNGKIAAIPRRDAIPNFGLYTRQDWLDKLGLKVPTTLDELLQVSIAFTKQDPDGNGKNDTFGYTAVPDPSGNGFNEIFMEVFNAYGTMYGKGLVIENGKAVYTINKKETRDALEFIKKFVESGSVDPEIFTNKNNTDLDKAYKGKVGIYMTSWSSFMKGDLADKLKQSDPNAKWVQIAAPKGPDSNNYLGVQPMGLSWDRTAVSAKLEKDPEKLARALEFVDYLCAGEGFNLAAYGAEGIHYKQENGKIIALDAMKELNYTYLYQFAGRNDAEYLAVKFPSNAADIAFNATYKRITDYSTAITTFPEGYVDAETNKYIMDETIKFIYGKRPFSEWNSFVDTLNKQYKLDLLTEHANKVLKEKGFIK